MENRDAIQHWQICLNNLNNVAGAPWRCYLALAKLLSCSVFSLLMSIGLLSSSRYPEFFVSSYLFHQFWTMFNVQIWTKFSGIPKLQKQDLVLAFKFQKLVIAMTQVCTGCFFNWSFLTAQIHLTQPRLTFLYFELLPVPVRKKTPCTKNL